MRGTRSESSHFHSYSNLPFSKVYPRPHASTPESPPIFKVESRISTEALLGPKTFKERDISQHPPGLLCHLHQPTQPSPSCALCLTRRIGQASTGFGAEFVILARSINIRREPLSDNYIPRPSTAIRTGGLLRRRRAFNRIAAHPDRADDASSASSRTGLTDLTGFWNLQLFQ